MISSSEISKESVSTGSVKLIFEENSVGVVPSVTTYTDAGYILPGQTANITGTIINTGTSSIYALIRVKTYVDGEQVGGAKFYTPTGTLIYSNSNYESYVVNDVLIDEPTVNQSSTTYKEKDFAMNFTLDFEDFNDEYQGKPVKVELKAILVPK